jgi:hypothetical protein
MAILYSDGLKEYKHPTPYDPQNQQLYAMVYRPQTWAALTQSVAADTLVVPTTALGIQILCIQSGKTGATEPTWNTATNGETTDGSVIWKTQPVDAFLDFGDTITASTWTGTASETVSNASIVDGIKTQFRLDGVPSGATSATIVNHITVDHADGRPNEEFDFTFIIKVKSR